MIRGWTVLLWALSTASGAAASPTPTVGEPPTLSALNRMLAADDYARAERRSEAYLRRHPGNRDARLIHALALAGQHKTRAATQALRALARDYPSRPEPANDLAVLYARAGDYRRARAWLEKALATQPAYATAHRNLGDVYTALADLAYRRALGSADVVARPALTLLDRFDYARQSIAATASRTPASAPVPCNTHGSKAAASSADARTAIVHTLRAWAEAWAHRDFAHYIDFYARDFTPSDDASRARWRARRRARVTAGGRRSIAIDDLHVDAAGPRRARVRFTQRYRSPGYQDRVVKTLIMRREAGAWRIVRETSGAAS